MSILEEIPMGAISPILALINAIVRIVKAGDDDAKQQEALMLAAEDMKLELDKKRFGA